MANGMVLHLGLRHHRVLDGPLLVDRSMVEGPLLIDRGMIEGPLLSGGGFGRIRAPRWHHGRTMVVPLGPDRTDKNTAQYRAKNNFRHVVILQSQLSHTDHRCERSLV